MKEEFKKCLPIESHVISDLTKNGIERPNFDRLVCRNCDVMFASIQCCQSNVATGLMGNTVSKAGESFDQIRRGKVARKFHAANTSSRTWCKRMMRGRLFSSGK